jgi:hypothetical protein
VLTLKLCRTQPDGRRDEQDVDDPIDEVVTEAVQSLNGDDRNDLYLRHASGSWMGLGAGPGRVFVGFSESEDGPRYQAVDQGAPAETVSVNIGGQPTELERKYLVSTSTAVRAALEFAHTGHRPTTVDWQEQ